MKMTVKSLGLKLRTTYFKVGVDSIRTRKDTQITCVNKRKAKIFLTIFELESLGIEIDQSCSGLNKGIWLDSCSI